MNGPRVMCSGCTAVEVPTQKPFCESCSAMVLEQLQVDPQTTQERPTRLIQIGPTDI